MAGMRARLRSWLPAEHGVWGLLAAAALVGLPLGSGLAGLPLLGAALVAILVRARCRDRLHAPALALGAGLAAAALWATWRMAEDPAWVCWLAGAIVPAGAAALIPGRSILVSVGAAIAFSFLGAAVAAAGGAPSSWCAFAAVVLAGHLALMVPLVRAQVRPDPRWIRIAIDLHVAALVIATGAWAAGLIPSGIPLVFSLGLARSALLVDKRTTMSCSPARIGVREMAWLPVVSAVLVLTLRGASA